MLFGWRHNAIVGLNGEAGAIGRYYHIAVYLLKNRCWSLPFRKTPLFAGATPSDWRKTASSRRFGVCKHRFPPKTYTSGPWRSTIQVNFEPLYKQDGRQYQHLKNIYASINGYKVLNRICFDSHWKIWWTTRSEAQGPWRSAWLLGRWNHI